jgi:threonine/homoserine/homoserine lactone efflux protein
MRALRAHAAPEAEGIVVEALNPKTASFVLAGEKRTK